MQTLRSKVFGSARTTNTIIVILCTDVSEQFVWTSDEHRALQFACTAIMDDELAYRPNKVRSNICITLDVGAVT